MYNNNNNNWYTIILRAHVLHLHAAVPAHPRDLHVAGLPLQLQIPDNTTTIDHRTTTTNNNNKHNNNIDSTTNHIIINININIDINNIDNTSRRGTWSPPASAAERAAR